MSSPDPASMTVPAADEKAERAARGARLAALLMLAIALIGLWKLSSLERWSIEGPGPGLFPMLAAGVFALLAVVVMIWPGQVDISADDDSAEDGSEVEANNLANSSASASASGGSGRAAPANKPAFVLYALSLLMLAFGSAFAGFTITAMAVAVIIVRFAEHRSWFAALSYGLICAVIGLVGFGWLLRVDLPSTAIERAFFALVR